VDVVINVGGEIIVDDMGDIGNIQATSGDSRGNQDRAHAVAKLVQGLFTLPLCAITVNRVGAEILV